MEAISANTQGASVVRVPRPSPEFPRSYVSADTELSTWESIRPYLEEFQRLLAQQYVVEFPGSEPAKKIKLNRKIGGAKLIAPKR